MIKVSVNADATRALKRLDLAKDQVPFATALALTRTAQRAKEGLKREIARSFDRPRSFTLNAMVVKRATKQNLNAEVKVKDNAFSGRSAVNWFNPEVYGGGRHYKGFELLLQRNGKMPSGWYAIPARNAPLDQYGNISGSLLNKILSQLGARRDSSSNESRKLKASRNRRRQSGRYFAVWPGESHLPPGIYERASFGSGGALRMVFLYTSKAPAYKPRYKFYEVGQQLAREYFPQEFRKAAAVAMGTRK